MKVYGALEVRQGPELVAHDFTAPDAAWAARVCQDNGWFSPEEIPDAAEDGFINFEVVDAALDKRLAAEAMALLQ